LWTSPGTWPAEVEDARNELCTNASGSFTDPQLLEGAASVLKSFRGLNLTDEEDRPVKRRKTLPDSSEDVNISVYEQLVMVLNGSTQDSPVLNLSDLHNLVQ